MRCLLDTHVVLWIAENSPKLSAKARRTIADTGNEKFVSVVSVWEVAIKVSVGKLRLDGGAAEFLKIMKRSNLVLLSLDPSYALGVERLPFIRNDPFDRMLVAAAIAEKLTLSLKERKEKAKTSHNANFSPSRRRITLSAGISPAKFSGLSVCMGMTPVFGLIRSNSSLMSAGYA